MDTDAIISFCKQFAGVTNDFPFGSQPECYRVGGRIFAEIYPAGVSGALRILLDDETIDRHHLVPMVTLRCEPIYGDLLRQQYPRVVLRPYHCPFAHQPYANTVLIDDRIPDCIIKDMIKHAYDNVLNKLPKKIQLIIMENSQIITKKD